MEFIDYNDLEKSIQRRLELFGEDVDCFVNVGGASANSGTSAYTLDFPNGLVLDPPRIPTTPDRGLMYEYAARGVPVINMLNVRGMAADNGLPYDPVPLPAPGEGGVYYETAYQRWIRPRHRGGNRPHACPRPPAPWDKQNRPDSQKRFA